MKLTKADLQQQQKTLSSLMWDLIPYEITKLTVTEWASKKRVIPKGAGPYPGPYRWDVTPYLPEIADCLSETSPVRKIAVMKGAQLGFTVGLGENWIGYVIDVDPGPMMYISGDADMAKTSAGRRVDAMIANAGLANKIVAPRLTERSRKSGDTQTEKNFAGGFLRAIGPNSGSKLRSDSIQKLYGDEVDAYPESAGKEGDPVLLAERRTDAYEGSRKILYTSTPLMDHNSKIKQLFLKGDQRYYKVPCKHCGHKQKLKWSQMKWDVDDEGFLDWGSVRYECEKCKGTMTNDDKAYFLPRGEWEPTAKPVEPGFRSYHLSSLYSPVGFRSWASGVQEFLEAKDDPLKLQTFVNTFLGETWADEQERPRLESILTRNRNYHVNFLPEEAKPLLVTLGADIQKDRIECEIVAWEANKVSWSVDYRVFYGDTEDLQDECWENLRSTILEEHAGLPIALAGIDSGYRTDTVYEFCDSFDGVVYPVMGSKEMNDRRTYVKLFNVSGRIKPRIDINTFLLKQEIYKYLNRSELDGEKQRGGYCHFPVDYKREHYLQLTAEVLIRQGNKYMFDAGGRRNERLDCRVYALACLYMLKDIYENEYFQETIGWDVFWDYIKGDLE